MQVPIELIPIEPPPMDRRQRRAARPAAEGEKRSRYSLPLELDSSSPVGYRTRVALNAEEAREAAQLLSLPRPSEFVEGPPITEQELFEESSLGVLSSRQSTNFRGLRQITLGPEDSKELSAILRELHHLEAPVLSHASHSHVILSRPYRTPFTFLLTFVGHLPLLSLLTVPIRSIRKKTQHIDDIPTIGALPTLHLGILADGMERAAAIASGGRRAAQLFMAPFSSADRQRENKAALSRIAAMIGMSASDHRKGWRIRIVSQVGQVAEPLPIRDATCRKLGANLLAFGASASSLGSMPRRRPLLSIRSARG